MSSDAEADVRALAERYYDAMRTEDLALAGSLMAPRLLDAYMLVGWNSQEDEPSPADGDERIDGAALARRRHEHWEELIPRSAWKVEAVHLDGELLRARVDTSAEGSYWMQRGAVDEAWRIIGFGWLTPEGQRQLGGDWPAEVH